MRRTIVAAVAAVALAGCGGQRHPEVDRFESRCHDLGGYVSAQPQMWVVDYTCVGQPSGAPMPKLSRG